MKKLPKSFYKVKTRSLALVSLSLSTLFLTATTVACSTTWRQWQGDVTGERTRQSFADNMAKDNLWTVRSEHELMTAWDADEKTIDLSRVNNQFELSLLLVTILKINSAPNFINFWAESSWDSFVTYLDSYTKLNTIKLQLGTSISTLDVSALAQAASAVATDLRTYLPLRGTPSLNKAYDLSHAAFDEKGIPVGATVTAAIAARGSSLIRIPAVMALVASDAVFALSLSKFVNLPQTTFNLFGLLLGKLDLIINNLFLTDVMHAWIGNNNLNFALTRVGFIQSPDTENLGVSQTSSSYPVIKFKAIALQDGLKPRLITQDDVNAEQLIVNAWRPSNDVTAPLLAANEVNFDALKAHALGFGSLTFKTSQFDYKVSHTAKASSGPLALTITVYAKGSTTIKGMPIPIMVNVRLAPTINSESSGAEQAINLGTINSVNDLFSSINKIVNLKQTTTFAQMSLALNHGDRHGVATYFSQLRRQSELDLTYNGQTLHLAIDLSKVIDDFAAGLQSNLPPRFTTYSLIGAMTNPLTIAPAKIDLNHSMGLASFATRLPSPCWTAYMALLDNCRKFLTTIAESAIYTSWINDKNIPANPYAVDWAVVSRIGVPNVGRPLPTTPIIPLSAQFMAWMLNLQYHA